MHAIGLVVAAVALAAISCSQASSEPPMVEPAAANSVRTGVLTVDFAYAQRTALYAEGARHYLQVSDPSGDVVLRRDEGTDQGPDEGFVDSVRLAPGRYLVQTYQRGCDFTEGKRCENTTGMDQDRCTEWVRIRPEIETRVAITVKLPQPCSLEVTQGR